MAQPSKPPAFDFDTPEILALVRAALDEDLGTARGDESGDLTANALVSVHATARARILTKQALVVAGLPVA